MSEKKTLLILAGGLGSRYNGLKQTDSFSENGHTILEYSLYDAFRAGFTKAAIVINPMISEAFKGKIANIFAKNNAELHFVTQTPETGMPAGFSMKNRTKPWGTAHAVLCAKHWIDEDFAVINADDFYGKETFVLAAKLLDTMPGAEKPMYNLAFLAEKTLSENGGVCRGICETTESGELKKITEICGIQKDSSGIFYEENGRKVFISSDVAASMNFWIFPKEIFAPLETYFQNFLSQNPDPKEECYIPNFAQELLQTGHAKAFAVISPEEWAGVTYAADKPAVQKSLREKTKNGVYPENLWK